ncbi:hypothetical protein WS68_10160 [Burkholderia sp. TSV86]|nr:hypothetical protein WS68_10160 [Burkholderia sp. TSV86]
MPTGENRGGPQWRAESARIAAAKRLDARLIGASANEPSAPARRRPQRPGTQSFKSFNQCSCR